MTIELPHCARHYNRERGGERERKCVSIAEGMSDFLCNNPILLNQYDPAEFS